MSAKEKITPDAVQSSPSLCPKGFLLLIMLAALATAAHAHSYYYVDCSGTNSSECSSISAALALAGPNLDAAHRTILAIGVVGRQHRLHPISLRPGARPCNIRSLLRSSESAHRRGRNGELVVRPAAEAQIRVGSSGAA